MSYKILIIEDNPEMRDNIASILELGRYQVSTAANGKIGVELAHRDRPDLILCDIMMPELDGHAVLHILGKNPDTAAIPFVFLTAKAEVGDIREGMSLGADDYLTKPFDGSELLSVVETRIRKHELVASSFSRDIKDVDSFFNHVKEIKGLHHLSSARQHRRVKRKEFLFMEGQEPTDLYFIQKGKVKTYKTSREGKELVTGIHTDGEFIGFLCLLEKSPYLESAVALEDTDVYLIPGQDFNSLIYSNREIATQFIKLLANNLVAMEARLLEMAYQSVRQRVASSLLKVLDQFQNGRLSDLITVSRRDLSGIVGTATESLNRTLADFRDEGMIKLTDVGIRMLDRGRLERVAK